MLAEEKLGEYETKLKDALFLNGNLPGKIDAEVLEACEKDKFVPCQCKYPNFWAWYSLMVLYEKPIVDSWKKVEEKKGGKPQGKPNKEKKEEKEDDDFDPFAEETEEDKENLEKMKKDKKKDGKKKKEKEPDKSLILLEVKGFESDQDLDALAKKIIKEVKREGLTWKKEYKLQDVAFGIKKIVMGCVVVDDICSIDDIVDELTSWEEEVQSVEIVSFNKL